jgi:hypothetical protein
MKTAPRCQDNKVAKADIAEMVRWIANNVRGRAEVLTRSGELIATWEGRWMEYHDADAVLRASEELRA